MGVSASSLAGHTRGRKKGSKQPAPTEDSNYMSRREWKAWENVVPSYIRYFCFAWQFLKFAFIFYLCTRQHRVLTAHNRIPRVLFGKLPPETFERAREYQKALNYLKMFYCGYNILHEVWIVFYTGFTKIWFASGPALDLLGIWPKDWDRETGESIMFLLLFDLYEALVRLPLDLYRIFVIEDKYGFNKMTLATYMYDWLERLMFETLFACVTGVCVVWIVREAGTYFFLWLWIFAVFWVLVTIAVYPNFIAPIFDTFRPLREGRLRDRLSKLAAFIGFPLEEIQVLEESWRSKHRDAYFYGLLAAKRIVLYDTLLEGYPEADAELEKRPRVRQKVPKKVNDKDSLEAVPSTILRKGRTSEFYSEKSNDLLRRKSNMESGNNDKNHTASRRLEVVSRKSMYDTGFSEYEIEALVARLMGNWVLGHSVKELVFPLMSLFFFFFIFSTVYENSSLFQAFAVPKGMDKPILLGLRLLYADVMDIYRIFVEWVMKYLHRQNFYEGDSFATRLGYGDDLIDAYIEKEKENLSYPYFDELYWGYHEREPSLLQRIEAIEKEMQRMEWRAQK